MKAISTRYIGATDRKPAHVIASDQDGNRVSVSVDSPDNSFPYVNTHRVAAETLCARMSWEGAETLIGGSVKHGMVWVFPPEPTQQLVKRIAVLLEPERRARCPRCGSTEGQVVLPGSGDSTCLACGADWPVEP